MSKNDGFFPVNKTLSRTLLIIATCISLMMLATIVLIVREEMNNQRRYQVENYAKLTGNVDSMQPLMEAIAGFAETLETESLYAIPFFVTAGPDEVASQLAPGPGDNPFIPDSMGYKVIGRLRSLIFTGSNFDTIVLYTPASGYYLGACGVSPTNFAFDNPEALVAALHMEEPIQGFPFLEGGTWFAADPFHGKGAGRLMITYALNNGMVLFCGVSPKALEETLFANVYGRSYEYLGACIALKNGAVLSEGEMPQTDAAMREAIEMLQSGETVRRGNELTIMRCDLSGHGAQLFVFLRETGATSLFFNSFLGLFMIMTTLWLIVVITACLILLNQTYRPIRILADRLSGEFSDLNDRNEFARITTAIDRFTSKMNNDRLIIERQRQQLGNSCLLHLMLDPRRTAPAEELDAYQIAKLVQRYAVLVISPRSGRWVTEQMLDSETSYRTNVALLSVENQLRTCLTGYRAAYMSHRNELIAVIATTEEALPCLTSSLDEAAFSISAQVSPDIQCALSGLYAGAEKLHDAYQNARMQGKQLGVNEDSDVLAIGMRELNRLDGRMANLIYVEKYREAYLCFKEMVNQIFDRQQNTVLRENQLHSLITRTYCMLLESNALNDDLLNQSRLFTDGMDLNNRDGMLSTWEGILAALEAQHTRSQFLPEHCSPQFAGIYRYTQANFRDAGLSLTSLADVFDTSVPTLSREFQKNLGIGFLDALHKLRIEAAAEEIRNTAHPLKDIADHVGYTNVLTMSRAFKKYQGITPGTLRKSV